MEKNRFRIIFLIGIVISLWIGFIIKDKLQIISSTKEVKPFSGIKTEAVKQVIFNNGIVETVVYKKNNIWNLKKDNTEYLADQDRINKVIDDLINLKKEEVVSTNKKKHFDLGIDKQLISLQIDNQNYKLYIGNNYSLNKNYLRINDENDVFIGTGFDTVFYPEDYRDLSVNFIKDENKITAVIIKEYGAIKLSLELKNKKWITADNKEIKKEKVDFLINDLKTLKASDFTQPDNFDKTTGDKYLSIIIKENNPPAGGEKTADFYTIIDNKENYYLKTNQSNIIFKIAAANVQSLNKEEKDYLN